MAERRLLRRTCCRYPPDMTRIGGLSLFDHVRHMGRGKGGTGRLVNGWRKRVALAEKVSVVCSMRANHHCWRLRDIYLFVISFQLHYATHTNLSHMIKLDWLTTRQEARKQPQAGSDDRRSMYWQLGRHRPICNNPISFPPITLWVSRVQASFICTILISHIRSL